MRCAGPDPKSSVAFVRRRNAPELTELDRALYTFSVTQKRKPIGNYQRENGAVAELRGRSSTCVMAGDVGRSAVMVGGGRRDAFPTDRCRSDFPRIN